MHLAHSIFRNFILCNIILLIQNSISQPCHKEIRLMPIYTVKKKEQTQISINFQRGLIGLSQSLFDLLYSLEELLIARRNEPTEMNV